MTYPAVVKEAGGRDKLIERLKSAAKEMNSKGISITAVKPAQPTDSATSGDERYVIVPYEMQMKVLGSQTSVKSFLLDTFGLNNTYVFCTRKALAKKYGLRTIGDLRRLPEARVVVDLSFLDRQDGWPGLVKAYQLDLPKPRIMSPDLRYKALESGDTDVVLGFATDWEIAFYDLAVLEDDKGYFPSYLGAPLVRGDLLRRHPEVGKVLNRLKDQIDDDTMRRLNYQVAKERRPEAAVARDFLRKKGLLP